MGVQLFWEYAMKSIVFTNKVYDLPYFAHPSYSDYIDLRSQPTRVDEIPELNHEPRLKPLVNLLNDPHGMFMTHACAVASRRPGIEDSTVIPTPGGTENAPCWYSSYVLVSFWVLNQNQEERYKTLYESYPSDKNESGVCFEVEPGYFLTPFEREQRAKWSDTNGTICGIWASGWGSNAREAQDRWSSGIDDLIAFFTKPPALDDLSVPTGITVSQHMFGGI
jgi:hypothetical protein